MIRLAALDMDGTLLDPDKEITPAVSDAMRAAKEAGLFLIPVTGRAVSEIYPYRACFPYFHSVIAESGGIVYDLEKCEPIRRFPLAKDTVLAVIEASLEEDVMVQLMSVENYVTEADYKRMGHFHMGRYQRQFAETATLVPDIRAQAAAGTYEKLNINHADLSARDRTKDRIRALGLPVTLTDSESSTLEVTAEGVNKATALATLLKELGISPEEAAAVGDGFNDISMMRISGWPIAMGNAEASVKAVAKTVVADYRHSGAAEAIKRILERNEAERRSG